MSKRRRLHSSIETTPTLSKKDLAGLELTDYFNILEKGLFEKNVDCLDYWLANASRFPILSKIAFQFLLIQATTASVERLFSCAGLCSKGNKTQLGPLLLESEVIARYNKRTLMDLA